MNGIVWLASYPKSGNTWLRIVLAHLLSEDDAALSLNRFSPILHEGAGVAADRTIFDELAGIDASDLLPDEIERLRPRIYEAVAAKAAKRAFIKAHDAWLPTRGGEPLLSHAATEAAIYVVRDPRDVAVSFAFHEGTDFDTMIDRMADSEYALGARRDGLQVQLRQRLSSWSGHVASWLDAPCLNRHVMRYEDMTARPIESFGAAARFLGLPHDATRLARAVESASFARLRQQEESDGFIERPETSHRFFREGRVGGWRDHLAPRQALRIVAAHGAMMRRLGYLDVDAPRAAMTEAAT